MKNGLYLVGSMVKFVVLLMPITTHFFFAVAFDLLGHNKAKRLFFHTKNRQNITHSGMHRMVCKTKYRQTCVHIRSMHIECFTIA